MKYWFSLALLALHTFLGVSAKIVTEQYVVGGTDKTMFGLVHSGEQASNCSPLPDIPFKPLLAVGLTDKDGNPMVCGGSRNPNPKSCYVFDLGNKTWSRGPDLKRKRVGASATCLDNKVCWIFGGKSKSYTEFYNPETGLFEMGPKMPVNSAHGLCTALAPSGLIYMAAVRQPGVTRAFTFDPEAKEFKDITTLDVEKRHSVCAVTKLHEHHGLGEEYNGSEMFVVTTGGVNIRQGTNSTYMYFNATNMWNKGPDLPIKLYGAGGRVAVIFETITVLYVIGGVTPDGEINPGYSSGIDYILYKPNYAKWTHFNYGYNPGRAFAIIFTVQVDYECISS